MLRNPYIDESMLPYRFSSVTFGKVTHVLYSNSAAPITPAMVLGDQTPSGDLLIEGMTHFWPFSVKRSLSLEQSLGKLSRGRIDAFLCAGGGGFHPAQDGADQYPPGLFRRV
ncbi:hypothetical protein ACF2JD_06395 [Aeromonas sp. A-5]|uniref:hypothetical protein n=1 Tax=Aeromonas ichthyocola TaxID=3367746 RepID=UPI0038D981F5